MTRQITYILLMAVILINPACSLAVKLPPVAIHDLRAKGQNHVTTGTTWAVGALDAPAWLWDDRIRYRLLYDDATLIRYYSLDRWEAPPPALLEQRLSNAGAHPDFILLIRLKQFEQEFDALDKAKAIISLDVEARKGKDQHLVGERSFKLQQMTASADAAGAIQSFTILTDQAAAKIRTWLTELRANK